MWSRARPQLCGYAPKPQCSETWATPYWKVGGHLMSHSHLWTLANPCSSSVSDPHRGVCSPAVMAHVAVLGGRSKSVQTSGCKTSKHGARKLIELLGILFKGPITWRIFGSPLTCESSNHNGSHGSLSMCWLCGPWEYGFRQTTQWLQTLHPSG